MPIYKIGSETFELDSPGEAAFIANKMGGVPFSETVPRIGSLSPVSSDAPSVEGVQRMEGATPSGRRVRVTVSTVPGSVRPLTPEEDAALYARQAQAEGREVSPLEAAFPRMASSRRNAGEDPIAALPGSLWQGTKDLMRLPGQSMEYAIRSSQGEVQPGSSWANALGDPTGSTYMPQDGGAVTEILGDILRDPITGMGAGLGSAFSKMGAAGRMGAGTALGIVPQTLDRAADYDDTGRVSPTLQDLGLAMALSAAPEAVAEGLGRLSGPAAASARRLFMSQVKALPGERNRQTWEAMARFSRDPENLREVIGSRSQYPDLAQGWREGTDARRAQVEPLYDLMEERGVRVPVESALTGMRQDMARVGRGAASGAEREAAALEMERLLTQPDPSLYPLGAQGADVLPTMSYGPREARGFKSDARKRIKDWHDPTQTIKDAAASGAGRGFQKFLEGADETGTLAAKNRQWGDWLGTEKAFLRMESRTANKNAPKFYEIIKGFRENPQNVKRMLSLSDALATPSWLGLTPRAMAIGQILNEEQ